MQEGIENYNLRVYGILILDNKVLVTDEIRGGMPMTKFPGGGLEKGEGLEECLIREFKEETNIDVNAVRLFYVNEFFQQSAFSSKDQLISFYFIVELRELNEINIDHMNAHVEPIVFKWIDLMEIDEEDFTFPIDKVVAKKLNLSQSF